MKLMFTCELALIRRVYGELLIFYGKVWSIIEKCSYEEGSVTC
ncbi:MAG: hypothetical protein OEV42_18660 [Deltaproteobacteria bacterium]|nr:hypothetical protein [Deltaproteobacteria bacterium]